MAGKQQRPSVGATSTGPAAGVPAKGSGAVGSEPAEALKSPARTPRPFGLPPDLTLADLALLGRLAGLAATQIAQQLGMFDGVVHLLVAERLVADLTTTPPPEWDITGMLGKCARRVDNCFDCAARTVPLTSLDWGAERRQFVDEYMLGKQQKAQHRRPKLLRPDSTDEEIYERMKVLQLPIDGAKIVFEKLKHLVSVKNESIVHIDSAIARLSTNGMLEQLFDQVRNFKSQLVGLGFTAPEADRALEAMLAVLLKRSLVERHSLLPAVVGVAGQEKAAATQVARRQSGRRRKYTDEQLEAIVSGAVEVPYEQRKAAEETLRSRRRAAAGTLRRRPRDLS